MPSGIQLRSDYASQSEPFCPHERLRGTHIIESHDCAFVGLPDLDSGRTLSDALVRLDWVAASRPQDYGFEWLAEMRDIGAIVQRVRTDAGPAIEASYPCDEQVAERRKRGDALADHFRAVPGGREAIMKHLALNGSVYGFRMGCPA